MTPFDLETALAGSAAPPEVLAVQVLVPVQFWNFEGVEQSGGIVVHRLLGDEVLEIFSELKAAGFPLHSVLSASHFGWSDDDSMAANNTSGFNYRRIVGKAGLSKHAWGRAIDINPVQNPYIRKDEEQIVVLPPGAVRDISAPGTLLADGPVVAAFESRGWTWGGRWTSLSDWHHFEKPE